MPRAHSASSVRAKKTTKKTTTARKTTHVAKASSVAPRASVQERAKLATARVQENIKKPKVYIPLIVVVLLLLAFLFKNLFVVALVNGQPISRMQYQQQLEAQAGKQVMSSLVTQSLLNEEAARRHITVSQSDLDTQVKNIQSQLALQGQTLDSALAAQGLSKDSFMQQLRLQALVQKMLADKIKVSDAEISDYISKNQSTLPTGESDAQVKAQVRQQLQQQKLSSQAQSLIQQLQAKAHITYFVSL